MDQFPKQVSNLCISIGCNVEVPTPAVLQDIIVEILARAAGGTREEWREVVGEIRKLSIAANMRSNWSIAPRGSKSQLETVAAAVEIVRAEHPYVATPRRGVD